MTVLLGTLYPLMKKLEKSGFIVAQAGDEAEEDGGENGNEDGPGERSAIDFQLAEQGQSNGALTAEPGEEEGGKGQAAEGSGTGEHQAFDEQLADDAPAA